MRSGRLAVDIAGREALAAIEWTLEESIERWVVVYWVSVGGWGQLPFVHRFVLPTKVFF
jgi:hypothetical protein